MKLLLAQPVLDARMPLLKQRVEVLSAAEQQPHLAIVLVGEDLETLRFVDAKETKANELGVLFSRYEAENHEEAAQILDHLACDETVHGIVLQLPVPALPDPSVLIAKIPLAKDVDGLREAWPQAVTGTTLPALLASDQPISPMVLAVRALLDQAVLPEHPSLVCVGAGRLVGQPVAAYGKLAEWDTKVVTEDTEHPFRVTREADILVTGTGVPNLVTSDWIKEGVVVVDASRDVQHETVDEVSGAVSPAKGGVGPLTVHFLFENLVTQAERHA